ncbi:MAG TPA: type I DNA topoisomerase [Candidatus Omnitrophota bacterium]|nr:type I DNA topoisomerase [Candidatus Omnitrophota bacterium]
MAKKLVIVESPAKAKTINKILGDDFVVESSMGHIVDLPAKKMGVDLKANFKPTFVVIPGKKKVLSALKKLAKDKEKIYIATDPDREGEAIGWHIKNNLGKKHFLRVVFHEITQEAVADAFKHPATIDIHKVNAQTTRRVLDRIVGYLLSPLLWKKVGSGLSAGRVQSVALRLIVDREQEIKNFIPQEYWTIEAELKKKTESHEKTFIAQLDKKDNKKLEINNEASAQSILEELKKEQFIVSDITKTNKKRNPYAPFITSTLQQDAFNKLGFTANRTMISAQQLYEGIDLGKEGPVGLITYMRTDSVMVAKSAITQVRSYIAKNFGDKYLPEKPNFYKPKKSAQEAHEAIRPTSLKHDPEEVKQFLTEDQYKLYSLIWRRFVASQMKPAEFLVTSVQITAGKYTFRASGSKLVFDGFLKAYRVEDDEENEKYFPSLSVKEILDLITINPSQHFTKPPPRYSDASLVKALEEDGIGRPSTYAPIIQTLVYRNYAHRESGYFIPSDLGVIIVELLVKHFPKIMDVGFTAKIEEHLDQVEEGKLRRLSVINDFYKPFKKSLDFAQETVKKTQIFVDEKCPQCGKQLMVKWGRHGRFISCSGFPECRFSKAFTTGVKCPEPGCGGELVERRSKRGKRFYGCSNYPKCRHTASRIKQPTAQPQKEQIEEGEIEP